MRIAIDAMGSDAAPLPEVNGALKASQRYGDLELILVGHEPQLKAAIGKRMRPNISIVHASEVITMSDTPMVGVRKKKDASLLVAMRLVKQGVADAVISAGNTGAVMLAARIILRQIAGVTRMPICQLIPTSTGTCLVLDLGANVDCDARQLCDFAEMGVVYSQDVLGKANPRVGLLNIGEEQAKGSEVAKDVHATLSAAPHVNFVGNVEPKALFRGEADVVVCDGFVGNVFLKTSEAAGSFIKTLLTREFKSSVFTMLGAVLGRSAFKRLKRTIDPNEYGGAPLLGANGVVIIMHGSLNATGVMNGINVARAAVTHNINEHIREGIAEMRSTEAQFGEKPAKEDVEAIEGIG
ncbi:MAG: phosphate acyltransferase PlsX [Candidatus Hydrogenedentes bacterium]|nr:phosphate acyltransferase PlsX [Candidatus Hydrogenedentota bacterium]